MDPSETDGSTEELLIQFDHRINQLEERVADLDERLDEATSGGPVDLDATEDQGAIELIRDRYDRYDAAVIEQVHEKADPGDHISKQQLKRVYKNSGIKRERTLSQRLRDLVRAGPFENIDDRTAEYLGIEQQTLEQ